MPPSNDYSLVNLPEGLRGQFDKVEQRLWRVETVTGVCRIAASLVLSLLLVFISDRLWETSAGVRAAIFLCGLGGALAGGVFWARRWVWQRRDLRALAALVQQKYRRLGDRLLGIVELANEEKHPANFSPELYHAAIQQVADEAEKFDFLKSVSARPAQRLGWMAGGFSAVLLAVCVVLPQTGANAFLRWIEPWADIQRHTLVALEGFPAQLIVPHGEPFEIAGSVRYRSFWKPARVSGRLGQETRMEAPVQAGKIRLQIPGQVEKGVLEVRVGDALARVRILPSHRPSLQQLSARIELPDYLQYPDQTEAVQNGSLRAVEGSKISFRGTVSRPLAWAGMRSGGGNPAPLKIQGQDFSSDPAELAGMGEIDFTWRDQTGLTNATPWRLSVQRQPDAPPVPSLPDLPRATALLASDVLRVRAEAEDDFGVRDLGLAWNVVSEAGEVPMTTSEMKVEMSSPQEKKTEKTFLWSPSLYQIPMDTTVALQAFAIDFFPGRQRARSALALVRVLSPAEHAEMLRQQMEGLMAQLEDVTRLQDKIVADLHGVQDAEKAVTNAPQSARLNQSKEDQLGNARQMEDLTRQGESTVREAMKNPLVPEDAIRKFSQTLQQWQQLSQEKMPEAARSMQMAAQDSQSQEEQQNSSSSPRDSQAREQAGQQQRQEVAQASRQAQDIQEALEKNQQKGNQDLDQLQALTLAERLRKVGGEETGLSGQLATNLADTIGLLARDLPPKFKQINASFVTEQQGARDETAVLQGEISRFFERTQKTNYGKVSQDMKDSQTTNELDRMGGLIQNNITAMTSSDLTNWAGRFEAWADELQPKDSPSGGQSGGGGQAPLDLTKQLIALLRLREGEMNLRDQTRVLEACKADAPNYKEQAGGLSGSQEKLAQTLAGIHQSTPVRQFDPPFQQAAASMSQAQALLAKPQTDTVTDGAEGKSVEDLSDLINLINELSQNSPPSRQPSDSGGNSAEEMAFLTALMQSSGQARTVPMTSMGGGNMTGGNTDREGNPVSGGASGPAAAARNVRKAAAGAMENYPVEFRDALENYFHALDNPRN
jgi:hypothetical protein